MKPDESKLKMLGSSKISPILRISMPRDVAKKLDADDGAFVIFYEDEKGNIILKKG